VLGGDGVFGAPSRLQIEWMFERARRLPPPLRESFVQAMQQIFPMSVLRQSFVSIRPSVIPQAQPSTGDVTTSGTSDQGDELYRRGAAPLSGSASVVAAQPPAVDAVGAPAVVPACTQQQTCLSVPQLGELQPVVEQRAAHQRDVPSSASGSGGSASGIAGHSALALAIAHAANAMNVANAPQGGGGGSTLGGGGGTQGVQGGGAHGGGGGTQGGGGSHVNSEAMHGVPSLQNGSSVVVYMQATRSSSLPTAESLEPTSNAAACQPLPHLCVSASTSANGSVSPAASAAAPVVTTSASSSLSGMHASRAGPPSDSQDAVVGQPTAEDRVGAVDERGDIHGEYVE